MRRGIDFGKTVDDYRRYRAGFPEALYQRLRAFGIGLQGQRILDLGTGTGTLARGFARRGCMVIGLDPSLDLLWAAQQLDREAKTSVSYMNAVAEHVGFKDESFEVVVAGQCWHWFNRPLAAREAFRLLCLGGHLVIAHFDWLPLSGNVVDATEQLILAHNPGWDMAGGTGIYPHWPVDVTLAGFQDIETFTWDTTVIYSHAAWRGRIRASAGVSASLLPSAVTAFDADLRELLARRFRPDPLEIPHRLFVLVCCR